MVSPIDHDTAMAIAAAEYDRGAALLDRLDAAHWSAPTVNDGWDVRATVGHMVGMMAMMSSAGQLVRQQITAQWAARRSGAPVSIDELTAFQVRSNAGLTVEQLLGRYRALTGPAVRGRRRLPAFVRRRTLPERQLVNGQLERWTVGYLADVILTRDPFMHRLDIHAATGLEPVVTAEHEGSIVDLVVREWAGRHGEPYTVELTGPAGGLWSTGGPPVKLDALDFCRIVSGRPAVSTAPEPAGLLAVGVPF
ncbi:hypothetical protein Ari01nite_66710 [Paractinoplanes rishiriensis]|uniref:Mycothiol-dependent maleylpyruvate isomerase metal-binding domain-containing protein n=2 Tax=Paractinoplanes rishiriensis TaxID=1050105 RepID=A0A919K9Q8_9ACTN|nr:hypothetical protein Ari01nite_66710 [Actinoplanes rishiriensis]